MTRQDEGKKRKNPFAKLFDDAGRMLEKSPPQRIRFS